jgi:hypothetical protein
MLAQSNEKPSIPGKREYLLYSVSKHRRLAAIVLVILGFAISTIPLALQVNINPSTTFGESIEGVVPIWYWIGLTIMIVAISYMLTRLNAEEWRTPFLISCALFIFSMRGVLAIIAPFPFVSDAWSEIYVIESWRKYGIFSPLGASFFASGGVRAWPLSYLLAYMITDAGVPVFTFFKWAPTFISILEVFTVYLLFKELANEKVGMVSAFLFTLLNTNGFFPLHYCPQTLGALFYLVTMFCIVKTYKTRKLKHLMVAIAGIFLIVLTHHMTTFFLGVSLAGAYVSKYALDFLQKAMHKARKNTLAVNTDTLVRFSLPLAIFTFALWYFYGFIVYKVDATMMLAKVMKLLTAGKPAYQAGTYGRFLQLTPLSQISILIYPAFILLTAAALLFPKILRRQPVEGYLWLTGGWAAAMTIAFILGNLMYGNYIEPLRALEVITIALYPFSALVLLKIAGSRSRFGKILLAVSLITVTLFSVISIYRGAKTLIYFNPPWWMTLFGPP